jgi:Cdc6-like AAA superfamily ATPase
MFLDKKDFDEAYGIIEDLLFLKDTISSVSDNPELSLNLYNAIINDNRVELNSIQELDKAVSVIVFRDVLACYFSLGFFQDYRMGVFDYFDLFDYAVNHVGKAVVYDEYNGQGITRSYYHEKHFNKLRKWACQDMGIPVLYSILVKIDESASLLYVEVLQRIVKQILEKSSFRFIVSEEGRRWSNILNDNPKLLLKVDNERRVDKKVDETRTIVINRDQFNMINKVTDELVSFMHSNLDGSRPLMKLFGSDPILSLVVKDSNTLTLFVKAFVAKDLCKCYNKLNHSIDIDTLEGKVLYMYCLKIGTSDTGVFNYDRFIELCNRDTNDVEIKELRKSCAVLLEEGNQLDLGVKEEFLFPYYLNQIDLELSKKYMVILYRCASVIAKIDGHISESESQWLSDLVTQVGISKEDVDHESFKIKEGTNPNQELDSLIGLDSVKKEVISLANFIKMKQMRESKGLKAPGISYHCVFTGNPGTGKTTVARILASIFKELGILQSGHLVETDRSGLVAEYVGQTAIKTNKIIDSALDGVLFVDEAYMLLGGQNDYGKEAIATLLKRMEDDRDRLIVILAGYSHEMEDFISSNPGLRSRFNRFIFFPDYSSEELFQIFKLNVEKNEYVMKDDAAQFVKSKLDDVLKTKRNDFGNARYVRNYFESVIEHQANRLASDVELSVEKLTELTLEDVSMGQINS